MKPELSIIVSFLQYEEWNTHSQDLTAKDFPDDLKLLYRTLDSFHKSNEEKNNLSLQDLCALFFSNRPKDVEYYEKLFDNLNDYVPNQESVSTLIKSIHKSKLLRELSLAAYEAAEGRNDGTKVGEIISAYEGLSIKSEGKDEDEFVTTDIEELLSSEAMQPGLTWRLQSLNESLGSLRKGNFGFLFARPETGKTTFLASEVSHMLEQVKAEGRGPIIWFNNEQEGGEVMLRIIQAYFGITLEQLYSNLQGYKARFSSEVGVLLKLKDAASIDRHTVERICDKYAPSLILVDQLDKLKGFDGDRHDLHLGAIYIWAREVAKKWAPVIGVSQADGSGEGVRWLGFGNVADAKTSKQAEADFMLGIGKDHSQGYESVRFINISKNKLRGDSGVTDPKKRHAQIQVLLEPEVGRYRDL